MSQLTPQDITKIRLAAKLAIFGVDPFGVGLTPVYILDSREYEAQVNRLPSNPAHGIRLAGT